MKNINVGTKSKIKLMFISTLISLIVVMSAIILIDIIRHPLREADIEEKMSSKSIVYFLEHNGILAFETKKDESNALIEGERYEAFIFVESVIFPRFRLFFTSTHNFQENRATLFAPGKRDYYFLGFGGEHISLIDSSEYNFTPNARIGFGHFLTTGLTTLFLSQIVYFLMKKRGTIWRRL